MGIFLRIRLVRLTIVLLVKLLNIGTLSMISETDDDVILGVVSLRRFTNESVFRLGVCDSTMLLRFVRLLMLRLAMLLLFIEKLCRVGTWERLMFILELLILLRARVCRLGKLLLKEFRGVLEMMSPVRLFRVRLLRLVMLELDSWKLIRVLICIERVLKEGKLEIFSVDMLSELRVRL